MKFPFNLNIQHIILSITSMFANDSVNDSACLDDCLD